jgi:N-methylhydantoinase B
MFRQGRRTANTGSSLSDGAVDTESTVAARADAAARPKCRAHFDFGPERDAFEAIWNRENYACLTALLARLPVHWRYFIKTKVFEAMQEEVAKTGKPSFPLALAFGSLGLSPGSTVPSSTAATRTSRALRSL